MGESIFNSIDILALLITIRRLVSSAYALLLTNFKKETKFKMNFFGNVTARAIVHLTILDNKLK
jgi:hypothetical protein